MNKSKHTEQKGYYHLYIHLMFLNHRPKKNSKQPCGPEKFVENQAILTAETFLVHSCSTKLFPVFVK